MTKYRVVRITDIDQIDRDLAIFFEEEAERISKLTGDKFNWKNFDFLSYARRHLFWVCYRGEAPVGAMLAQLFGNVFDRETKILRQDLLCVKPGNSRATYLLVREFIDFGKANANHVFTTTHEKTNIKGRSLEKLGFKKIEELYRLEC